MIKSVFISNNGNPFDQLQICMAYFDLQCHDPVKRLNTTALEAEIDQLVYQLYALTAEEIAIVEGSVK